MESGVGGGGHRVKFLQIEVTGQVQPTQNCTYELLVKPILSFDGWR
jgi:hypothetical protein